MGKTCSGITVGKVVGPIGREKSFTSSLPVLTNISGNYPISPLDIALNEIADFSIRQHGVCVSEHLYPTQVLKSGTMTRAVLTNVINDLDKKNDVGALLIGFNADRRYWDDPTNKYRHVVELAGYKDRRNLNTDLIAFRKALCDSTASCSFIKTFLSKCIVGLRFNSHRRLQQLKMKEYANAFGYKDDGSDFCVEFEK